MIFSKNIMEVLAVLVLHPEQDLHQTKIATESGLARMQVQRALKHLEDEGLVEEFQQGNMVCYQLNHAHPLLSDIKSILYKTSLLAKPLQQALEPVASEIQLAFIYGSMAKQEDTAKSDVDLMLISDTLSYAEIFPLLEPCQQQLGRKINPIFYSVEEWTRKRDKQNNFILKVLAQPKIFLIGNEDELKQL